MVKVTLEAVLQPSMGDDHPYIDKMNFQISIHLRRYRRAIEMVLAIAGVSNRWHFTMANNNTIEVLFHKHYSTLYWVILFQRQLRPDTCFLFKYRCSYDSLNPNNPQNKHRENRIVK